MYYGLPGRTRVRRRTFPVSVGVPEVTVCAGNRVCVDSTGPAGAPPSGSGAGRATANGVPHGPLAPCRPTSPCASGTPLRLRRQYPVGRCVQDLPSPPSYRTECCVVPRRFVSLRRPVLSVPVLSFSPAPVRPVRECPLSSTSLSLLLLLTRRLSSPCQVDPGLDRRTLPSSAPPSKVGRSSSCPRSGPGSGVT